MIPDIDAALQTAYEAELRMIKLNGGDKSALQFRYEQLRKTQQELLDSIERQQVDILGREKALKESVRKLQDMGDL